MILENISAMNEIVVYGAGMVGKELKDLIDRKYGKNISIKAYMDREKKGFLFDIPIYATYEKCGSVVVIAMRKLEIAMDIYKKLKEKGFEDIYWFCKERCGEGEDFFSEQCLDCKAWNGTMLSQVEMHIMDSCNLNCQGCAHYSPIFEIKKPVFSDRILDVVKLSRKFEFIKHFYILGGEPFLNPEIGKYAVEMRKILKFSDITIVTNGLLIPSVDDDILKDIYQSDVEISISEYEPTRNIIHLIKTKLDFFGIPWTLRSYHEKKFFSIPLTNRKNNLFRRRCISPGCVTIWNGSISRCPQVMYIGKLNEVFRTKYPDEGSISLDDPVCGEDLLEFLARKVPLCDYCIGEEVEWKRISGMPSIHDFVMEG